MPCRWQKMRKDSGQVPECGFLHAGSALVTAGVALVTGFLHLSAPSLDVFGCRFHSVAN